MTILLVDHKCHLRTKSFDFVRRLLSRKFTVMTYHYDVVYKPRIPETLLVDADVVVFLEFLASRFALGVVGKRCVYFPMYDNEWGSVGLWRRLALLGMNVISFSRRVSEHARRCGVKNLLDVRYAFDPSQFKGMAGNPRIVALWERGGVSFDVVKKLFAPSDIDKVVLIRRYAENVKYMPISEDDAANYHVEIHDGGFLPDGEYKTILKEPGIYLAPRFKEGIGMAFLEQMAMGKCVIAHCDATMDEYIENGKTGILMNMRAPFRVSMDDVSNVRERMVTAAESFYAHWIDDENKIVYFFQNLDGAKALRSPWSVSSLFWYMVYLVEGICLRITHRNERKL